MTGGAFGWVGFQGASGNLYFYSACTVLRRIDGRSAKRSNKLQVPHASVESAANITL